MNKNEKGLLFGLLVIITMSLFLLTMQSFGAFGTHDISKEMVVNQNVKVGECDYIFLGYSDKWGMLVHRGDCKNPIHKQ